MLPCEKGMILSFKKTVEKYRRDICYTNHIICDLLLFKIMPQNTSRNVEIKRNEYSYAECPRRILIFPQSFYFFIIPSIKLQCLNIPHYFSELNDKMEYRNV